MHRFKGMSYKDIAVTYNVSPKTIDYRIQQALKLLREDLKDYLMISNKVETMQEMLTMLQGRRLEQNVMEIMPFGISLYIAAAYPGYFGTLYHNGMGIIVMTLCLAVYAGAYLLGEKILDRIEEEL